nr:hypothetical protein [uncultured Desulfobacter sp.]
MHIRRRKAYAEASAEIFIRDQTEDDFFKDEVRWETLSLSVDLEAGDPEFLFWQVLEKTRLHI